MESSGKKFSLKNTELISWYTLLFGITISLTFFNAMDYVFLGINSSSVMTHPLSEPFTLLVFYFGLCVFWAIVYQFLITHIWYKVFFPLLGSLVLVIPLGFMIGSLYEGLTYLKTLIPDNILLVIASILKQIYIPFNFLSIWGPVIISLIFIIVIIVHKLILAYEKPI